MLINIRSNTLPQKLLFYVIERDAVTLRYHLNKEHVENVISQHFILKTIGTVSD